MFRIAIYKVRKQIIEKFMTIEQKYTIILNLDKLDALNNENVDDCLITRYVFKVKACLPQGCVAFA